MDPKKDFSKPEQKQRDQKNLQNQQRGQDQSFGQGDQSVDPQEYRGEDEGDGEQRAQAEDGEGNQNEGEGSRTAARRYNQGVQRTIENRDPDDMADDAEHALEGENPDDLRDAEEEGKERSFEVPRKMPRQNPAQH